MAISAAVTSAIAAVRTAVAATGTLQGASIYALAAITTAVNSALSAVDTQAAAIEATIDQTSVGGIHVGTPAPQLAMILIAQSGAVSDLSTLRDLRGYLARLGRNVANASP